MEPIKVMQTWDPIAGRKHEYATFITDEFRPTMQALGLEVVAGWYVLVGQGPHILVESIADSLDQVELIMAFEDEFGGEISDEEAQQITTVGEAVTYLQDRLEAGE